jgi:hypothetical protein
MKTHKLIDQDIMLALVKENKPKGTPGNSLSVGSGYQGLVTIEGEQVGGAMMEKLTGCGATPSGTCQQPVTVEQQFRGHHRETHSLWEQAIGRTLATSEKPATSRGWGIMEKHTNCEAGPRPLVSNRNKPGTSLERHHGETHSL